MVGLVVFVLYLRTLAPDVLHYSRPGMFDPAMLQAHVSNLGISHPTGYPAYLMLTHLFTYLPFGNEAYAINLASAVYGALTVVLVYVASLLITGRAVAAAGGALAFGLGVTYWSQAVIAEVYTLNTLLVMAVFVTLLYWRRAQRDRYLLAAALVAGLAMTNHMTSGLLLPVGLLFVFLVDRSRFKDLRLALKGAGLFLAGLLPYLYLPIRASMDVELREAQPNTLSSFLTHVTGSELNDTRFGSNFANLPSELANFAGYAISEYHIGLLALASVGLGILLGRDPKTAALTGGLFAGWLIYSLGYDIPDIYVYFIPTFLMVSLWISCGAGALLEAGENLSGRLQSPASRLIPLALSVAVLLVPFIGADRAYAEVDRSGADQGRRTIEAVAGNVEPGATVIHNRSALWYMTLVEERRRDLTLVDPFHPRDVTTHDLLWPREIPPEEAERIYQTGDTTGVPAAQEAAEDGPVYILEQQLASGSDFTRAGFEVVPVERGILYRLVPPEESGG